ncbi:MAG: pyruvate ferredoxin oxidoreductase [Deltaproteobacteria bacterium]|nr:pyruvate ferredoxin oxidoreductase [Deltaproteobacteria bacterium]
METRTGMEASIAIAEAVCLCDADIVAAYPITPQTHIVEHLSELVADGKLHANFVPVESEHSAMSVCCGTSAVGARTYTATASQGLALMHEILFIAPALRLPIVMSVANRSLSGPISIWNDHSDVMAERDIGWVQIFAENAQQALDLTIWAFRLAEDRRVSLPVMVNFDGFILSHTIEPVLMPDKETVQAYLPPFEPLLRLDVDAPVSMGPVGIPDIYTETHHVQQVLLTDAYGPIVETLDAFGKHFGREYKPVETYRADDAEVLLLTMGALGETAMEAVDLRRERGQKVGLLRLRLWRPFPFEDLYRAVGRRPVLGVMDRAISYGGPYGPVASEIKAAFYHREQRPRVVEFVAGLGGRDVPISDFDTMFDALFDTLETGRVPEPRLVGLRE